MNDRTNSTPISLSGIRQRPLERGASGLRPVSVLALVICGALLTAGLLTGWLQAQFSPMQVAVRGAVLTDSREVLAALDCSGGQTTPQLWLKTRAAVPETLRWVRDIRMQGGWNRRITLQLTERRPLLLLNAAGTKYWLCDDNSLVPLASDGDKPVLATVAHVPRVMLPFEAEELSREALAPLITAAACCTQVLEGQVSSIELDKDAQISLLHKSGLPILLGGGDLIEAKVGALPKVLRTCGPYLGKLRYIDARDPHVFYEKWKSTPEGQA